MSSIKNHIIGLKAGFSKLAFDVLLNSRSKHLRHFAVKFWGGQISENVYISRGVSIRGCRGLVIEEGTIIGPDVLLDGRNGLHIGQNVVISYQAVVWTMHHDPNSETFGSAGGPVTIGDYAWVCSRSIVLPGRNVGMGAVLGSGAILTHDLPDYEIWGGNPAHKINERKNKNLVYKYVKKKDFSHFV